MNVHSCTLLCGTEITIYFVSFILAVYNFIMDRFYISLVFVLNLVSSICFAYHIQINSTLSSGSPVFDASINEHGAVYALDSGQAKLKHCKIPFEIDKENGKIFFIPNRNLQENYLFDITISIPRKMTVVTIPLSVSVIFGSSLLDSSQRNPTKQELEVEIHDANLSIQQWLAGSKQLSACPSTTISSILCSCTVKIEKLIGNLNPTSVEYRQKVSNCKAENVIIPEQYTLVKVTQFSQQQPHKSIATSDHRRKRSTTIHFKQLSETVGVSENLPANSLVKQMKAYDSNGPVQSNVEYKLEASQNRQSLEMFSINRNTGALTTKTVLDREQMQSHFLTVVAVRGESVARCYLRINVIDKNDQEPQFEEQTYSFDLPENQRNGTLIGRIRATDGDEGTNSRISYSIAQSVPPTSSFAIRTDGLLVVNGAIDREEGARYILTILARDGGQPAQSSSVTVKVVILDKNDNTPQFGKAFYNVPVKEDVKIRTNIITVLATDRDEGLNGEVTYAIIGGNNNRKFAINSETGVISIMSKLDYEESPEGYALRIRASDRGTPSLSNSSGVVNVNVVDVNDNTPQFISPVYHEYVMEDVTVGSEVGRVKAFDSDYGPSSGISYSIVSTLGISSFPFQIESRTGIIRVSRKLDYESNKEYHFVVRASDSGQPRHTVDANVTVTVQDVNDNAPIFSPSHYGIRLPEDTRLGTQLVRVTATDPDDSIAAVLTYQITEGNKGQKFSIASYDGVGVITLYRHLNYEQQKKYKLKVRAFDGHLENSTYIYINVTDTNSYQPTFDKNMYEVPLSEGVAVGTVVLTVHASDKDSGDNARITYCFTEPVSQFKINPITGIIRTTRALNFETQPRIRLMIQAHDNGIPQKEDYAQVVINLLDQNDNSPDFDRSQYHGSISEDCEVFERVITIHATDRDSGVNAIVRYTFDGGNNGDGYFTIDETTGIIRTAHKLDREYVDQYQLVALAVDSGSPPQSSSVTITIDVTDVDDNPPRFPKDVLVFNVTEDVKVGEVVAQVHAKDPDLNSSPVSYELNQDPLILRQWRLDSITGELTTAHALDYETKKNYSIIVSAMSNGLVSQATIVILVQDCNDNKPVLKEFEIIFNNYRAKLSDTFPTGVIGRVPAYDPDVSDKLSYRFVAGNQGNLLLMDPSTGQLRLNSTLDSNRQFSVSMMVGVTDGKHPVKAKCTLRVTGINDDMLRHSITVRILHMDAYTFLSPVMYNFTEGLSEILRVPTKNIYIFNVQNDTDVERQVLNVSFSARSVDGDFFLSKYLQDQVYLNRLTLTKLTGKNVLPFDDNICLREPCQNYKRCTSVLTFDSTAPFVSSAAMIFRPIYPVYRLKCECPIGFTNDESCSDEVDLCFSNPCANNGECLPKEGGYSCVCEPGFTGVLCQINMEKATCASAEGVCQNGGRCSNATGGGISCDCSILGIPDGNPGDQVSPQCELRTRRFRPGNFLTLRGLTNQWHFSLSISFATVVRNGLLFYNGRLNHEHDFMTLELVDGQVQLNFSTGQSWSVVDPFVSGGLNDGKWHTVLLQYYNEPKPGPLAYGVLNRAGPSANKIAVLTVDPDACDSVVAANWNSSLGSYSCSKQVKQGGSKNSLDLTSPLLLGGVPNLPEAYQVHSKEFDGCLRDLVIDGRRQDLAHYVANNGSTPGCSPMRPHCSTRSCVNGGRCEEKWDGFQCACRDGNTGRRCEHQSTYVGQLTGRGCLRYLPVSDISTFRVPWHQKIAFRTIDSKDAVVMHVGLGTNSAMTMVIKIESGHVFYVIKTTSGFTKQIPLMETLVSDGEWHEVAVDWVAEPPRSVRVSVFLDNGAEQTHVTLDQSRLQALKVSTLYIGGVANSARRVNSPFKGCVQNVQLGSSRMQVIPSASLSPVGGAVTRTGCDVENMCLSSPCPRNSHCVSEWSTYKCICNRGYAGTHCESVCRLDVCQNGAVCRNDAAAPLGYRCNCRENFYGLHCETHRTEKCPAGWYGTQICAPCDCPSGKNFDSKCDEKSGECRCKDYHYYVSATDSCVACDCYHPGSRNWECSDESGQCSCKEGIEGKQCTKCSFEFSEVVNGECRVINGQCPRRKHSGVWWPRTPLGVNRKRDCPYGAIGTATRKCDGENSWLTPDLSNCTSKEFHTFDVVLKNVESNKTQLNAANSMKLGVELDKATTEKPVMYERDVVTSYDLIRELLKYQTEQSDFGLTVASDASFTGELVHATSNLFNNHSLQYWTPDVSKKKKTQEEKLSAPLLVQSWEKYVTILLENVNRIYLDSTVVKTPNMNVDIKSVTDENTDYVYEEVDGDQPLVSVRLPEYLFKTSQRTVKRDITTDKPVVGIVTYKQLDKTFPLVFEADRTFRIPKQPNISSILVTVQVYGNCASDDVTSGPLYGVVDKLQDPVVITFKLTRPKAIEPQCVFWNYTAGGTGFKAGGWSQRGCTRTSVNDSHVTCSCDHLTSFAVLTDGEVSSVLSLLSVRIVMIIGVCTSLAFLFGAIASTLVLPGVKSVRALINRNMALSIFLSCFLYLIGIQQTANIYWCMAIAVGLHFLVMSTFAWMFVDGVHLYRVLTEKRDVNRGKMRVYYLLGWVLPAIITALSVGLEAKGYGNSSFCWISFDDFLVWSITGPAFLCCAIFMLLLILSVQAYFSSKSAPAKRQERVHELRSSFVIAPVIACTWAFGLFAVNLNSILYCHLFSISCAVLGVLVFVLHCLLSKEIRRAYQKYRARSNVKVNQSLTTQRLLQTSNGRTPDSSLHDGMLQRFNNSTSESLSLRHIQQRKRSPTFESGDVSDSDVSDGSYGDDLSGSDSSISLESSSDNDECDRNTLQNIRNTRPQFNNHVHYPVAGGNGSVPNGQHLNSSRVKFRSNREEESLSDRSTETAF